MKTQEATKRTKTFTVNLWDLIDIDKLNEALDCAWGQTNLSTMPVDIAYECRHVSRSGELTVEATFEAEIL